MTLKVGNMYLQILIDTDTGGPRIARTFVPKILRAIRNRTIWIYTSVRAENRAIARNRVDYTIKLRPFVTKKFIAL